MNSPLWHNGPNFSQLPEKVPMAGARVLPCHFFVRGESSMNKKLVALGVASAFALPLAAQAQTANVTLYGRANVDVEWVTGKTCASPTSQGNSGTVSGSVPGNNIITNCLDSSPDGNRQVQNPTVMRLSSNSSRFGMRGTESLGGGLNAIFQVEQNVSWDSGNSSSSGIAS